MPSSFSNSLMYGGSALLLVCITLVYLAPSPTDASLIELNRLCSPHCRSGCSTRGPGRCDTKCGPLFRLSHYSFKCIPRCGRHCLICSKNQRTRHRHCIKCRPGFTMKIFEKRGETICVGSGLGRGVCDPACTSGCSVPPKCDSSCKANYLLSPTTHFCERCDVNCDPTAIPGNCTSPGTCQSVCKTGFVLDTVISQCTECSAGCSGGCKVQGAGFCDGTCYPTYVLDSTLHVCNPCDVECASTCSSAGMCSGNCAAGYGRTDPTAESRCYPCDSNCDPTSGCNVKGAGLCDQKCKPGYALDTSAYTGTYTCQTCQDTTKCSATDVCPGPGLCSSQSGCVNGASYNSTAQRCL